MCGCFECLFWHPKSVELIRIIPWLPPHHAKHHQPPLSIGSALAQVCSIILCQISLREKLGWYHKSSPAVSQHIQIHPIMKMIFQNLFQGNLFRGCLASVAKITNFQCRVKVATGSTGVGICNSVTTLIIFAAVFSITINAIWVRIADIPASVRSA